MSTTPETAPTLREALASVGLTVGARTGDYIDRRDILDEAGHVVLAKATTTAGWALYRARRENQS